MLSKLQAVVHFIILKVFMSPQNDRRIPYALQFSLQHQQISIFVLNRLQKTSKTPQSQPTVPRYTVHGDAKPGQRQSETCKIAIRYRCDGFFDSEFITTLPLRSHGEETVNIGQHLEKLRARVHLHIFDPQWPSAAQYLRDDVDCNSNSNLICIKGLQSLLEVAARDQYV